MEHEYDLTDPAQVERYKFDARNFIRGRIPEGGFLRSEFELVAWSQWIEFTKVDREALTEQQGELFAESFRQLLNEQTLNTEQAAEEFGISVASAHGAASTGKVANAVQVNEKGTIRTRWAAPYPAWEEWRKNKSKRGRRPGEGGRRPGAKDLQPRQRAERPKVERQEQQTPLPEAVISSAPHSLLNSEQAAATFGISVSVAYQAIKNNKIRDAVQIGVGSLKTSLAAPYSAWAEWRQNKSKRGRQPGSGGRQKGAKDQCQRKRRGAGE